MVRNGWKGMKSNDGRTIEKDYENRNMETRKHRYAGNKKASDSLRGCPLWEFNLLDRHFLPEEQMKGFDIHFTPVAMK